MSADARAETTSMISKVISFFKTGPQTSKRAKHALLITHYSSLLLTLLLISSCTLTEPNYSPENQIKNSLYDISRWFDNKNLNPILDLVHEDYLHNGMTKWNFRELWQDRMGQYALLDISAIQLTFNGDYATVKMVLDFTDPEGNLTLNEPWDSGDLSYFYYNGNSWVICGNQFVP